MQKVRVGGGPLEGGLRSSALSLPSSNALHAPPALPSSLVAGPSKAATATEQKDARGGVDKATTRTGGAAVGTAAYWAPKLFKDEHSNPYATDV